MDTYFELLNRLGPSHGDEAQQPVSAGALRKAVASGLQLLQVVLSEGDHQTLRRFALETASAAQRLGAPPLEEADRGQLLACLSALTRLSLRLTENLRPRRAAERLLGRSPLAKLVLREIALRDRVQAAELRRHLAPHVGSTLTQANLSRVVKRLAAAGWVSIDRTSEGVPWYGITLQGHAAARELFGDVPAPRRVGGSSMQHRLDGAVMGHWEAEFAAPYCLPRPAADKG